MPEPRKKDADEKKKWRDEKEEEWRDLLKKNKEGEEREEVREEEVVGEGEEEVREPTPKGGLPKPTSKYLLLVQLGVVILVAVAVCFFMVPRMAPSIGEYEGTIANIERGITSLSSFIIAVNSSIPDISGLATKEELTGYATKSDLGGYATTRSLEQVRDDIISIVDNYFSTQLKNEVEYSLTGTFGNCTLSARTLEAGNFTARLNLVYTPARSIGTVNSTHEEALLSFNSTWLTSLDKDYSPTLVYDVQWKISQVSFLTGKFGLTANNLTDVSITFTGLNVTPDYVFVEVFKVL